MDENTIRVTEFHEAYGFHVAPEPSIPALSLGDKKHLDFFIEQAFTLARRLKVEAEAANDIGRTNLGLLLIRMQLHVEETAELFEAAIQDDVPHVLRELADCSYVTDGTWLTFGMQSVKEAAQVELHRANMSKLEDGRPLISPAGRSIKGRDFVPPDMERVLMERPGGA